MSQRGGRTFNFPCIFHGTVCVCPMTGFNSPDNQHCINWDECRVITNLSDFNKSRGVSVPDADCMKFNHQWVYWCLDCSKSSTSNCALTMHLTYMQGIADLVWYGAEKRAKSSQNLHTKLQCTAGLPVTDSHYTSLPTVLVQ